MKDFLKYQAHQEMPKPEMLLEFICFLCRTRKALELVLVNIPLPLKNRMEDNLSLQGLEAVC